MLKEIKARPDWKRYINPLMLPYPVNVKEGLALRLQSAVAGCSFMDALHGCAHIGKKHLPTLLDFLRQGSEVAQSEELLQKPFEARLNVLLAGGELYITDDDLLPYPDSSVTALQCNGLVPRNLTPKGRAKERRGEQGERNSGRNN